MSKLTHLLIVEDEPEVRLLLSQIFQGLGYFVQAAENGFAALRIIRAAIPEILLSDLHMPGMSGFELLSVVRRLYPEIHVIAMSGAFSGNGIPEGLAADDFHAKGSGMGPLLELMQRGANCEHAHRCSKRRATPVWVALSNHVPRGAKVALVTCPGCLRPFRHLVDSVTSAVQETVCLYCGGQVEYAIAMTAQPRRITQA
jgi:CheY-like chemotaxis protein